MIQRIQTVYLSSIVLIAALLLALGSISEGSGTRNNAKTLYNITFTRTEFISPKVETRFNTVIVTGMVLCILTALISIFQYKNLKLQKRLCTYNFIVIAFTYAGIFYRHFSVTSAFSEMWETHFSYGLFLSLTLILFNFLAFAGIRKDIGTLASADRLR